MQKNQPKSNGKVLLFPANFYAAWRSTRVYPDMLGEASEAPPPEKLLQQIWQHQRLQHDRLLTLDNRPVRVLHPGFWNHEAGPDFRGAVLQIGSDPPLGGDVEIDPLAGDWRAHGHDRNPAYHKVLLHVVWDAKRGTTGALPTLCLRSRLDAPLRELAMSLDGPENWPPCLAGRCQAVLKELPAAALVELLWQAAWVRFQQKGDGLEARARQVGWEQSLWEGLLGALGYKHNVWPMRRTAELLPSLRLAGSDKRSSPFVLQARMLGITGLLPSELPRVSAAGDDYVRTLWSHWWREREAFTDFVLPRAIWRLSGVRPANHPQRRLALAAHWLAADNLEARLEKWLTENVAESHPDLSLLRALQVRFDPFWSWHWTFASKRLPRPQPLLGTAQVTDLAVNVILPWFWVRAVLGKSRELPLIVKRRFYQWPAGQDNTVLRLAGQRLFGRSPLAALPTAAAQQGLLQIARDFCSRSNALCEGCQFTDLVGELISSHQDRQPTSPGEPAAVMPDGNSLQAS